MGPSFLGIGAQKAGTTWLYGMLKRHPDVGMPEQKELHFWDRETLDEDGIQAYLMRFAGLRGTARGEITPSYAILPPERIALLHRHLPGLRIIYILRDPIERAWSQARMDLGKHLRRHKQPPADMDAWLDGHFRSEASLARGDYAACLGNWRRTYGEAAVQVHVYEEAFAAPRDFMQRCAAHIGIDAGFYVALSDSELADRIYPEQSILKRAREEFPPGARERHAATLAALYAPRVAALSGLLGRDLTGLWPAAV
jgi:hypothetical protein